MLIKNDTKSPKRWVNGSIGVVTELSKDSIKLRIKNKRGSGNTIKVNFGRTTGSTPKSDIA